MQFKKLGLTLLPVFALILSACNSLTVPAPGMKEEAAMTETMADEAMTAEKAMLEKTPETMDEAMTASDTMMKKTPDANGEMHDAGDMMTSTKAATDDRMGAMQTPSASMDGEAGMMEAPAWYAASLTDARTGEAFTINEFKGKVILVETMAIWCSTCLRQQREVVALHAALGERDDFISIGLDVDPNEDSPALKDYADAKGFTWLYAISPAQVSSEISQLYGLQFVNPPSAPMLIIDRHGEAHPLPFGIKSAADLQQALEPFLSDGM